MSSSIRAAFATPSGAPLRYADLPADFIRRLPNSGQPQDQFEVMLTGNESKAGNTYYQWDLNGVPLPDGFATRIHIAGQEIRLGGVHQSRQGNEMCSGQGTITVESKQWMAKATIVRTRKPFWIKLVVHVPGGRRR